MGEHLLELIVTLVLSSGTVAAILTYVIARRKAPAEVDSIVVKGAESAVLSLEKALTVERTQRAEAEKEARRLRDEVAKKDRRIEALEKQLDRAQEMLNEVRAELERIRHGA